MLQEELRLALERVADAVVEVGKALGVGGPVGDVAQVQPLPREVLDEGPRLGVGEHAADLAGQLVGRPEPPLLGRLQELLVGDAAPEEEREPGRQVEVREAMHVPGPCAGRSRGRPEEEARRDEHPAEGHLDAVVEAAAVGPPHREQAHEGIDVGVGDGAPVCAPGQRGQDAPRARRLGPAGGRAADEEPPPALGVARPRRPVGAADEHVVDGHAVGRPAPGALAPGVLGQEPRRDLVLARREGHAHLEDAAALVRLLGVEVGVEQADPGAVDAHVELRGRHAGGAPPPHSHLNRVLGVEGKVVIEQDAAARVGGQPRDLAVPPRPPRGAVTLNDGDGGAGADHEPADAPRRRHVLLDVQRRHRQHVADVVEPVAGVVGRQVARVVEVEPQEIAHRVAVLGPVQPVDGRRAGVGPLGRGAVQPGLEPRHELGPVAGVRGGPAGRRHLPRPELVQDLLEDRGLLPHRRVGHAGQGQAGGAGPVVVAGETVAVDGGSQEVAGRR